MTGKYDYTNRRKVEVGVVYGRYTVLCFAGRNSHGNLMWDCECSCGNCRIVAGSNLLQGTCPSCGCYKSDMLAKRNKEMGPLTAERNTTHGKTDTDEFRIWVAMKRRCKVNKNYVGRVDVCRRWGEFVNFLEDMGVRPSKHHTLERVNNEKGYSPDNCVWATRKTQARNTRRNDCHEYKGEVKCVAEWSEISGIHVETLRKRIKRWGIEKALTTPIRPIQGVHY